MLRPGTHPLRRSDGRLQLGLSPDSAIVLPDSDLTRRLVDPLLVGQADPQELGPLIEAGVVVDEATVRRRPRRSRCRVVVRTFGHPSCSGLGHLVRDGMADLGLPEPVPATSDRADVVLVVGVGEPHRELIDPWIRSATPHVLLRFVEGSAVLGPWIVPGTTPCLRCIDAHHTDRDSSWPLLVRQYADASARDRRDGQPEPVDPALAAIATGWLARDLATFLAGGQPSTWGATLHLPPDLAGFEVRTWLRHPQCGCGGL